MCAFVLGIPEHKLRVVAPDVGGGFGSKIFLYNEETALVWASKKIKRPIKWTADRSEAFLTDAHGRDHVTTVELGAEKDGTLPRVARDDDGEPRRLPVDVRVLRADDPVRDAARGPVRDAEDLRRGDRRLHQHRAGRRVSRRGAARGDVRRRAHRRDRAHDLGIDPAEIRRRNFITTFPYATPVGLTYDTGDYEATMSRAIELGRRRRLRGAQGRQRGERA